jgi:hypothetical protein
MVSFLEVGLGGHLGRSARALSGFIRRKSPRTIRVQQEGTKEEVSVSVPREAFELFLDMLAPATIDGHPTLGRIT